MRVTGSQLAVVAAVLVMLAPRFVFASADSLQLGERLHADAPPGGSSPPKANEPPPRRDGPADASSSAASPDPAVPVLEQALDAWRQGDWPMVRSLLEPLVGDGGQLDTPERTEMALRYLADATLFDTTLDDATADRIATRYIVRLLDEYPGWDPPAAVHGPRFYEVSRRIQNTREAAEAVSCEAENLVCQADLHELRVQHETLQSSLSKLQTAYDDQEVVVTERIARSRGPALVPFGVGQFYNGRPGLGALFLGLEATVGGAGLGLLINRSTNLNCRREKGFATGSLTCSAPEGWTKDQERELEARIVMLRNWEQGLGIAFIGLLAADVLVAQLTFEPYTTQQTRRVPRRELDNELRKSGDSARRSRTDAKLQVSPYPALLRSGAGLGLHVEF